MSDDTFTSIDAPEAPEAIEPDVVLDLTDDVSDVDGEDDAPAETPAWAKPGKWYVVHTQSGYEKKVDLNLRTRISSMDMGDSIYEIVIPMEDVVEFKQGRKQTVQKKVFPGYLLVRCEMDDDTWFCIRNTPGVTGFVGQSHKGQKPTPLSRREVETFLSAKGDGQDAPKRKAPKMEYEVGESVRVKEGPFADFNGSVAEINTDHMKLTVLVNIFGRETLVEIAQIIKSSKEENHGKEEACSNRKDPDPSRKSNTCSTSRYRTRTSRCADHGLREAVQRCNRITSRNNHSC
jgi:transcription termination/antitermination protein NusG